MNNKEKILENVDQYSAMQLVEFIRQGIVSLDELIHDTDGKFTPSKRKEVKTKLEGGDDDEFNRVKTEKTIEACRCYLNMYPRGKHRDEVRDIMDIIEDESARKEEIGAEEAAWCNVSRNDINSLQEFIALYPASIHVKEANKIINNLMLENIIGVDIDYLVSQITQIQTKKISAEMKNNQIFDLIQRLLSEGKVTKSVFLEKLQDDHNLLSAGVVRRLIDNGIISIQDLISININKKFIQKMMNREGLTTFVTPEKLEKIHKQSTEVYFWGIPSSGKSCALGAILSVAASGRVAKSMDPDIGSQGYGYMTKLINLFQNGAIGNLMTGTDIDAFYEMGFDLVDSEGKIHPITCIDMAGELMRCMYKSNAGDGMSLTDEEMLDTLTKVLIDNKSTSRKMHIFVIEYGAEDRLYEGLPQKVYLDGALSYIKNTGLFKRDTDAIYIMISKADKVKNPTKDVFNDYISEHYLGFYNGLERICVDNEINKGKVEKIAFSLGDVCFQDYCLFDAKPAENVVRLLLARSASYRGGKLGKFERIFRG